MRVILKACLPLIPLCLAPLPAMADMSGEIVSAARERTLASVRYDSAYVRLSYPMGDVDNKTGVCTDVVIRALRAGADYDLQKAVHEDMRDNFSSYPEI